MKHVKLPIGLKFGVNFEYEEKAYIIGGLVVRRLKGVKQARAAFQSINYALIVEGIWAENLQLLVLARKPIKLQLFIWRIQNEPQI